MPNKCCVYGCNSMSILMLQLRNDIVPLNFLVMMIYVKNGYERFQTKI